MPGIVLAHSHHNPKWEGELQDMGMTWARAGTAVLRRYTGDLAVPAEVAAEVALLKALGLRFVMSDPKRPRCGVEPSGTRYHLCAPG